MASNPLVSQGVLNRLRGSIVIPNFPELNITASFLGKEGIGLAFSGESVTYIDTMAGQVTSPEPYIGVTLSVALLKTQSLSDLFKQQMELNALLGDVTVRSDAITLSVYSLVNCSIKAPRDLRFNGEDAVFGVTIGGFYNVNSSQWDL